MAEYIDKQKLMKNFGGYDLTKCQKYGNTSQKQRDMSYDTMMMYEIADEIDCAPAADVAPVVHGKWLNFYNDYSCAECDRCGTIFEVTDNETDEGLWNAFKLSYKYCPNCGAKMDEVSGDE